MKINITHNQDTVELTRRAKINGAEKISTPRALCLYLFFGTLIGDITYLLAVLITEFNVRNLTDLDSYKLIAIISLLSYPVALFIGGVPALISGALINTGDKPRTKYIRAGAIGFIVSILFYAMFVNGFNKQSALLGLLGTTAAIGTRFRINQLEKGASFKKTFQDYH